MHRSTNVRPGDRVLVIAREEKARPAAEAIAEEAIRSGADVQVMHTSSAAELDLLLHADDATIGNPSAEQWAAMEWADVCITIRGSGPARPDRAVPAERIARFREAQGRLSALRSASTRWVIIRLPDADMAAFSGVSPAALDDIFWAATLRNWDQDAATWESMLTRLNDGHDVSIVGPRVDLHFRTTGRRWLFGDGRINLPDGEIYTAPREATVNGWIRPSWPSVFGGMRMDDLALTFREGQLVSITAASGEEFARSLVAIDEGASRVGEIGFGTNPAIPEPVGDLFFDEKILGSMHLALGRAYAECGGTNRSALHWDIVHDLRDGSIVTVDGMPICVDGRWRATVD